MKNNSVNYHIYTATRIFITARDECRNCCNSKNTHTRSGIFFFSSTLIRKTKTTCNQASNFLISKIHCLKFKLLQFCTCINTLLKSDSFKIKIYFLCKTLWMISFWSTLRTHTLYQHHFNFVRDPSRVYNISIIANIILKGN